MKLARTISLSLLVVGLVAGCRRSPTSSTPRPPADAVVAIGDSRFLTAAEAEALWNATSDELRQRYLARGQRGFFEDWSERELFVLEGEARGIADRPDVRARLTLRRSEVLYEEAVEALLLEAIPDADAQAFYSAHRGDLFHRAGGWVARMIATTPSAEEPIPNRDQDDAKTPEAAKRKIELLLARAQYGEDFEELARRFSEDPSAPNGGRVELANDESTPAEARRALAELAVGDVSGIVTLPTGYAFYRLEAPMAAATPPFEAIAEDVRRAMLQESPDRARRLYAEALERLRQEHPITIEVK